MNRINLKFQELKDKKKKAFVAFITAGDPDLKTTEELVMAFEKAGVDIIELGVPFSDPLADGPTIQASYQRALKQKVTLSKILKMVGQLRKNTEIPIVLMTSYNPVFHFGDISFINKASQAGVDGLIIPDLPPEEATDILKATKQKDMAMIFLVAPTTQSKRLQYISQMSSGFVYYVSVAGVTGERKKLAQSYTKQVKAIQNNTETPVCVGFGISTPEQVQAISKIADGVIVGSAIVKTIANNIGQKNLVKNTTQFIQTLTQSL